MIQPKLLQGRYKVLKRLGKGGLVKPSRLMMAAI